MFKLVLALVAAFAVAVFAVQNANPVDVVFFQQELSVSLAVLILGATLIGALIVFLLGLVQQIGWGMKLRNYRRQVQELEQQLEELQASAAAAGAEGYQADELEPGAVTVGAAEESPAGEPGFGPEAAGSDEEESQGLGEAGEAEEDESLAEPEEDETKE